MCYLFFDGGRCRFQYRPSNSSNYQLSSRPVISNSVSERKQLFATFSRLPIDLCVHKLFVISYSFWGM